MTSVTEDKRVKELFRQAETRLRFRQDDARRLLKEYPDKFVVFRGEIPIETADDLLEMVDKLKARNLTIGGDIWFHYFPSDIRSLMH